MSVLAPADSETALPALRRLGGPRDAGALQRLRRTPQLRSGHGRAKVGRWLEHGDFDVLHLHEPMTPSVSVLALMAAEGPIVATFHTSMLRSRTMQTAYPIIRPSLEKIAARIAVSEDARRTVTTHVGGDAVVIPNGVYVRPLRPRGASRRVDGHPGTPDDRLPRPDGGAAEGPARARRRPAGGPPRGARPAGPRRRPGRPARDHARGGRPRCVAACEFLGAVSDEDKASLLAVGRPLRRAEHRRGELRDHPHRGDVGGRLRPGQRPPGVLPGARRRRGRARCSSTRTHETSPARSWRC